jgi:hypothetical protein
MYLAAGAHLSEAPDSLHPLPLHTVHTTVLIHTGKGGGIGETVSSVVDPDPDPVGAGTF